MFTSIHYTPWIDYSSNLIQFRFNLSDQMFLSETSLLLHSERSHFTSLAAAPESHVTPIREVNIQTEQGLIGLQQSEEIYRYHKKWN
jgi:hypothetical protein